MPFYYDGLCADHLRTWEVKLQKKILRWVRETVDERMESNKRGGKRRCKFGCMAENSRRHRYVVFVFFVICYLLLETFPSRFVVFFASKSMSFLEIFFKEKMVQSSWTPQKMADKHLSG